MIAGRSGGRTLRLGEFRVPRVPITANVASKTRVRVLMQVTLAFGANMIISSL
jgi:hypothetical protein